MKWQKILKWKTKGKFYSFVDVATPDIAQSSTFSNYYFIVCEKSNLTKEDRKNVLGYNTSRGFYCFILFPLSTFSSEMLN